MGISLKQAHADALLALRPSLGFVVMEADDVLAGGEAGLALLDRAATQYPVCLNGGALFGDAEPQAAENRFAAVARLADRVKAPWVAGHWAGPASGAWSAVAVPPALSKAGASLLAQRMKQANASIGRPVLLEWPFSGPESRPVAEAPIALEVCSRAGCKLLLDVNRLLMGGIRRAWRSQGGALPEDPAERSAMLRRACAMALEAMWEVSADAVAHVRLAGFRWPAGAPLAAVTGASAPEGGADSHIPEDRSQRISESAWEVYEHALVHLDEISTSIQWDTDLPPLAVLLDEARLAAEAIERSEREGPAADEDKVS